MGPITKKTLFCALGVVLAISYTFILTCRVNNPNQEQLGDRYLAEHHYLNALETYRKGLSEKESPTIHLKIAKTYLLLTNYDAAIEHFQYVLVSQPANHDALLGQATANFRMRRYDRAEESLQPLLRGSQFDPEAACLLGSIRLRQGNLEEARLVFSRLLGENPGDKKAHLEFWTVQTLMTGNADDSNLAEAAGSDDPEVSLLAHDIEDAKTKTVGKQEDGYLEGLVGIAYLTHGGPEVSKLFFERSLLINPNYEDSQVYLGVSLLYAGESKSAVETLEKTASAHPQNVPAIYSLGLALRTQRRYEEAISMFRKAASLSANDNTIQSDLAMTYILIGDYSNAEKQFMKIAADSPLDIQAQLGLSRFYLDRGFQVEKGLAAAEKAIAIDGNSVEAEADLGWAFFLNGRSDESETHLRKAVAIAEDYAPAHYYLGMLEQNRKNTDEAFRQFQMANDLDSTGSFGRRAKKEIEEIALKPSGPRDQ